jgi:hypothetical protein
MNEEKFKLWRLALSTIHLDGKVTPEEEAWFDKTVQQLGSNSVLDFSDAQVQELKKVLKSPVTNFIQEAKDLKKPADCSMLLHYLNMAAHLDSDFSEEEKKYYQELQKACLEGVDVADIQKRVQKMENDSYHKDEVYRVNNSHSYFESAFKTLLKAFKS